MRILFYDTFYYSFSQTPEKLLKTEKNISFKVHRKSGSWTLKKSNVTLKQISKTNDFFLKKK